MRDSETSLRSLTTLAEIDRAILSRLDVDRVIETVVTRIRDIVQTDYISVAVLDRTAAGMMRIYTRDQHSDEHHHIGAQRLPRGRHAGDAFAPCGDVVRGPGNRRKRTRCP